MKEKKILTDNIVLIKCEEYNGAQWPDQQKEKRAIFIFSAKHIRGRERESEKNGKLEQ